ncbi:MAG: hypothetical protein OWP43_02335 [Sphaerochaetaceae bacterium]|nr:hypothetical protein [Sphaerochaetaceae bacterium]
MDKLQLNLENCYGIKKLNHTFNFSINEKSAFLIYAPNGVMKTSLANTFIDIVDGRETKDFYFPDRKTTREIKIDENSIIPEQILVVESYKEDYTSENISALLVNAKLKKEYDNIQNEIINKFKPVIDKIKKISGFVRSNPLEILLKDFNFTSSTQYDCFVEIGEKLFKNKDLPYDYSKINYKKLFTKDAETLLADSTFCEKIEEYINQYEKLISNSLIFKKQFNHNNADNVIKSLKNEGFFKAENKVVLSNSDEILDQTKFESVINEEKEKIIEKQLKAEFDSIDKLFNKKVGTRELRELINTNKDIIPELKDIKSFKQKIWYSYFLSIFDLFYEAVLSYKNNKEHINTIIKEAQEQRVTWNNVVDTFNNRFINLPFTIQIANKTDVILKSDIPSFDFVYKDNKESVIIERESLINHLSNGEKRALYLLNIIFEIEARKKNNRTTLLILDDIADSFDYKNKYAIIEYLKEIISYNNFNTLILTHNFDFYRTVGSRLGIKYNNAFFVSKYEDKIELEKGEYFNNVFSFWKKIIYKNNHINSEIFIAAIAFIRNIIECTLGDKNNYYGLLTNLLHIKNNNSSLKNTNSIICEDLIDLYNEIWKLEIDKNQLSEDLLNKKVIDLIFEEADRISTKNQNSQKIEKKIILSIAIRLKAEQYMIRVINNQTEVDKIRDKQTYNLKKMMIFDPTNINDVLINSLLENVLILTSENIHLNSFMYEPIIDMSLSELIKLYAEIKTYLT